MIPRPQPHSGRWRAGAARRLTSLVAAAFAAATLLLTPALAPPASAGCPDAEVVFARGTGEPPGLGRVGQAFVSSLRQQTNKSIGTYGVNYPANGDFLAAADGANDASDHIQQMASACRATRLVLGGYSQGAAVIDIVTAAPLPGLGFTAAVAARSGRSHRRDRPVRESLGPRWRADERPDPSIRVQDHQPLQQRRPDLFGRQPVASAPRLRARDDQPGGAFRREQDLTRAAP